MKKQPRASVESAGALSRFVVTLAGPAGNGLIALLLGSGLALPVHAALGLITPAPQVVWWCLGAAAALSAARLPRWWGRAATAILLLAVTGWAALHWIALTALPAALVQLAQGRPVGLQIYSAAATATLCMGLTAVGFWLSRRSVGFHIATSLTLAVLLSVWFHGDRSLLPLCLPALLALCVMYALSSGSGASMGRVLPMAALAVLVAYLLLPSQPLTMPSLEKAADSLRQTLYDYLFFTEPRTVFSLQNEGFMPMGAQQLGGPANPNDREFMRVRTDRPVLLRGTVKDTYTGLSWQDSASGRRYLYIDPRYAALRESLWDLARPSAALRRISPLFAGSDIEVAFTSAGTSTLFLPQRFTALRAGTDMVPYFNVTSEVFITRDVAPGDRYTVSGAPFTADSPGIAEMLAQSAIQEDDAAYAALAERYTQLPQAVDPRVTALAHSITEGLQDPYEQAIALTAHLRRAYPYALDQDVPPNNRDFVSWFLLEERKGYCTSFASALAVMGRSLGLPARYIEGYMVTPENGTASVTGWQAHAWVEIYFSGFGWLSFDPTPGQEDGPNDLQNGDGQPPPGDSDDTPPDGRPTPQPTPTPPPEGETQPSPQPTPESDEQDDTLPTPAPTPSPPPEQDNTPPPEPPPPPPNPPALWPWLLLLLLLLSGVLAWRATATHPRRVCARRAPDEALLVWYRALTLLLCAQGLPPLPSESPVAYLRRAESANPKQVSGRKGKLTPVGYAVAALRYGGHAASARALINGERAYALLWQGMNLRQKTKALARRMLRGVGDVRRIP